MKFKVKKEILLESLNNTARAISTKNLIPILTGIKFELKEDGLYLYASDTDVSIRSFISKDKLTSTSELGSIVIGGKYIVEIIRKLPNTDISIEVIDGYKLIVSTDNTEFNLNGINPNEFPNLDLDETKEPIVVNNGVFKDIINQTVFATSQSETRPLLTGTRHRHRPENDHLDRGNAALHVGLADGAQGKGRCGLRSGPRRLSGDAVFPQRGELPGVPVADPAQGRDTATVDGVPLLCTIK